MPSVATALASPPQRVRYRPAKSRSGRDRRRENRGMATIVAFHAHPDDEVLLTGGTLARLAADGHRVVIVMACSVPIGGAGTPGSERLEQLRDSAAVLGAA